MAITQLKHRTPSTFHRGMLIKFIAGICFLLLAIAAVAAWNVPAKGYEPSIYSATPIVFWAAVIFSTLCGIAIVISQICGNQYKRNNRWVLGFLLIFLSFTLCIGLFIIRGYYMWDMNGDTATHLGFIKIIMDTGHAPDGLFRSDLVYPVSHFFTAEMTELLHGDPKAMMNLVTLYLGMLYIGFIYLLARAVLGNKGQAILAVMAGCVIATDYYVPLYVTFMPFLLANFFFPLTIFTVFKALWTKTARWSVLAFLLLFASVPFHPVLAMAIIATGASLLAFEKLLAGMHGFRLFSLANIGALRNNYMPPAIMLGLAAWFVLWLSRFPAWDNTINSIVDLIAMGGQSYAKQLIGFTSAAQGFGYNIIEYAIRTDLTLLAFSAVTLICLPFIVWYTVTTRKVDYKLLFYAPFVVIYALVAVLFLLHTAINPTRLLAYIFAISVLFVGFALYELIFHISRSKHRYLSLAGLGVILVVLLLLFTNGMLTLYPSPYILKASELSTKEVALGAGWILEDRTMNMSIASIGIAPYRYADALLTPEENKAQQLPRMYPSEYAENGIPLSVPYHFGYDKNSSIAVTFKDDTYLVLSARDRSMYNDVFPRLAEYRYSNADYERLGNDKGLFLLYTNGGIDDWLISHRSIPSDN
jgi:hypothetical protein